MPDYDAFGREIGEDPLKRLRENTNPAPAETTRVVLPREEIGTRDLSEPEPVAAPEPAYVARPEFVRPRRRRRGGVAGLGVLFAIIAVVAVVANSAVEKGGDLIDEITTTLPDLPETEEPAPPPVGLQGDSLVRADNFAAALTILAASDLGRPTSLRIAPDRIDAQLLDGNTIHVVQVTPDGELRELGSSQGAGRPIAFKAIDPSAPERLVRRGATGKSPPRDINYLVISPGPPQTVGAYFKSGRIVIGDAHGRPQRVL